MRAFSRSFNQVRIIRTDDFRIAPDNQLPRTSTLIDGQARQTELEAEAGEDTDDSNDSEAHLMYAMVAHKCDEKLNERAIIDNQAEPVHVPDSFKEALRHEGWRVAIDKEYHADRLPGMNLIP